MGTDSEEHRSTSRFACIDHLISVFEQSEIKAPNKWWFSQYRIFMYFPYTNITLNRRYISRRTHFFSKPIVDEPFSSFQALATFVSTNCQQRGTCGSPGSHVLGHGGRRKSTAVGLEKTKERLAWSTDWSSFRWSEIRGPPGFLKQPTSIGISRWIQIASWNTGYVMLLLRVGDLSVVQPFSSSTKYNWTILSRVAFLVPLPSPAQRVPADWRWIFDHVDLFQVIVYMNWTVYDAVICVR